MAGIAAAVVFLPAAAMAQAGGSVTLTGAALYMAIAGFVWYALDKIIDLLPIRENTIVQVVRAALNSFFAKKPQ